MKFITTKATVLKRDSHDDFGTEQSSDLPDEFKVKIPKGTVLNVAKYSHLADNKHYKIELKEAHRGSKVWYVYEGHLEADEPKAQLDNSFLARVIRYMDSKNYEIGLGTGEITLVGIEGCNLDGSENTDEPNHFNDVIATIEYINGKPTWKGKFLATTEPGKHYTFNPLNPKGAARLEFGQYRAWQIGKHRDYEALVQTGGVVSVRRDGDKNFNRNGDFVDPGYFGLNIHHGGNAPKSDIGRYSAGCAVIRSTKDFAEFLAIAKKDIRYKSNPKFVFSYALLPGDKL